MLGPQKSISPTTTTSMLVCTLTKSNQTTRTSRTTRNTTKTRKTTKQQNNNNNNKKKNSNNKNSKNTENIMKIDDLTEFSKKLNHLTILTEIINLRLTHVLKYINKNMKIEGKKKNSTKIKKTKNFKNSKHNKKAKKSKINNKKPEFTNLILPTTLPHVGCTIINTIPLTTTGRGNTRVIEIIRFNSGKRSHNPPGPSSRTSTRA